MRVGYVLQDPERAPTGLDVYTWNLWQALRSLDAEHELVPVMLPMEIAGRAYLRAFWEQCYLPLWAWRKKVELLHVPAGSMPVLRRRPSVLTLHDLGEESAPGYRAPLGPRLYFGRLVPWTARFATAVIADSEATKRDAVSRLGITDERITVIPLAAGAAFRPLPPEAVAEVRRKYGLSDAYFLHVGARIPRKNLAGALAGFARLLRARPAIEVQLAVAGGAGFGELDLTPDARELVARRRVRFLGHVPQDDLVALYTGALAVVVPSFYEGFGLPLLEAFACGTPGIASNVASLPEVAGDAALYVDPHDPDTIANAMERYATSPELREEMARRARERSRNFSWRKTAEATLAIYRRVASASRSSRPVDQTAAPKVLFVRLDSLGDVVLTTPCFEAVKRRYPGATVDVVVQPAPAAALEGNPYVDHVYTLAAPWRGRWRLGAVREVWRVLRRLRRERYDCVVTFRRDLDDALFARLCGGRQTLGFYASRTRPFLSGWARVERDQHLVENQLRLMGLLGCDGSGLRPAVYCTSGDPQRIEALLGAGTGQRARIGLAPFGSSGAKTWDVSQLALVIDALAKQMVEASIVLLGSRADRSRADAVLERTTAPVIDLVGQTSIAELCDVLRRCGLLVCVDSGPMHLAAALGVPTVALFGSEDATMWGPYGEAPHRVARALDRRGRAPLCAASVRAVVEHVQELLQVSEGAAVRPPQPAEVTS
jgi:ADP-heptose:LPS heptosyltransferase/glycosyltransferase involved in cell wall biosynthesis